MNILVTGGSGYIGSHTCVELINAGHKPVIVDNLSNSSHVVVDRIAEITGKRPDFIEADVRDTNLMAQALVDHKIDAVIHFAALKAVGESVVDPLRYYENNVGGIISLCQAMIQSDVQTIIFSSSATVYGKQPIPYTERTPRAPENPYGNTKFISELLLQDLAGSKSDITTIALRYFNPVGAHPSGKIGEDPKGIPNNLMPFVSQVAAGKREKLTIFGNDYDTPDGTAIRDYIHVVDLAKGHVAALEHVTNPGFHAYNLGGGTGSSVLEVVKAFESANHLRIPYVVADRRAGDLPSFYADPSLAAKELKWKVELTLEDACRDTWNWQSQNPNGYA